ncbi:MAG TPA: hypothetical protein VE197_19820 [Mycobacterium sp.]|nr:hypothetical protein [Mycobacterium sp.]
MAASPWQASAGAVNIACAGSRKDLTALAERLDTRGAKYSTADTNYTATDDDGCAQFCGLAV